MHMQSECQTPPRFLSGRTYKIKYLYCDLNQCLLMIEMLTSEEICACNLTDLNISWMQADCKELSSAEVVKHWEKTNIFERKYYISGNVK